MTVEELLKRLYKRGYLAKNHVLKVKAQLAKSPRAASVESVIRGLINSKLVTQAQIDDILASTQNPKTAQRDVIIVEDSQEPVMDLLPVDPPMNPAAPPSRILPPMGDLLPGQSLRRKGPQPDLLTVEKALPQVGSADVMDDQGSASRSRRLRRRSNPWDSPLILYGGSGLILLMLTGLGLFLVLYRGSGDDLLKVADGDYEAAHYANAEVNYTSFVQKYPRHPSISFARVRQGLTRIRRQRELAKEPQESLDLATSVLAGLQGEEAFAEVRPELAGLLPDIAAGIADAALRVDAVDKKNQLVQQGKLALELVDNSAYIPSSQRKNIEGRVETIRENLQVAERDVARGGQLEATLQKMRDAMTARDPVGAYEARRLLLQEYPALRSDESLIQSTQEIAEAEKELIRIDTDVPTATQDEPPPASEQTLIVTRQLANGTLAHSDDRVHLVSLQGYVYAFQLANGELLWRRSIGITADAGPWQIGSIGILWDASQDSLLGVDLVTGKLRWRIPVPAGRLYGTVDRDQLLVASAAGRLLLVDATQGKVQRSATFPRGLAAPPCRVPTSGMLLQPAEHSTIYVLDGESWQGRGNFFLGHAPGTLTYSPVAMGDRIVVTVHSETSSSQLHVVTQDASSGQIRPAQDPLQLVGRVLQPLQGMDRRRQYAVTDRGVVAVLGGSGEQTEEALRILASTVPTAEADTSDGYATFYSNQIWVGDTQLTRFQVLSARGEIVRRDPSLQGYAYLGPLSVVGDALIQVTRAPGRGGATISAWRGAEGKPLERIWETEFAVPRAGELIADPSHRRLLSVSVNGAVHAIDVNQLRQGIASQPLQEVQLHPTAGILQPLRGASAGDSTRSLFVSDGPVTTVFRIDLENEKQPLRRQELAQIPGQIATPPVPFAGGVLVATRPGPILLIDRQRGTPLATPFQPRQEIHSDFHWLHPVAINDSLFSAAESTGKIYTLQRVDGALRLAKEADLSGTLRHGLAGNSERIWVTAERGQPMLFALDPNTLATVGTTELPSPSDWGPVPVANGVCVSCGGKSLIYVDSTFQTKWALELSDGPLMGEPKIRDTQMVVATMGGDVLTIDLQSGTIVHRTKMHEPISGLGGAWNDRMVVTGSDGTLHILPPQGSREG